MKINIIVAIDEKKGIGKNNQLLWHISEDLKRFKEITFGHPIIMGRKTYESIGRVLPNRTNIIITRDATYKVEGAIVCSSLEEAIDIAKKTEESSKKTQNHDSYFMIHNSDEDEVFIIGGGQIFKEALDKGLVDKLYLTVVKGDYDADTFFPDYKALFRKELAREDKKDEKYQYTFVDLQKV